MKPACLTSRITTIINVARHVVINGIIYGIASILICCFYMFFKALHFFVCHGAKMQSFCKSFKRSNGVAQGQKRGANNNCQNRTQAIGHDSIGEKNNTYEWGDDGCWNQAYSKIQCNVFSVFYQIRYQFHIDSKISGFLIYLLPQSLRKVKNFNVISN